MKLVEPNGELLRWEFGSLAAWKFGCGFACRPAGAFCSLFSVLRSPGWRKPPVVSSWKNVCSGPGEGRQGEDTFELGTGAGELEGVPQTVAAPEGRGEIGPEFLEVAEEGVVAGGVGGVALEQVGVPGTEAVEVAGVLTGKDGLGEEGVGDDAAPEHPAAHGGEAARDSGEVRERADVAVVDEGQCADLGDADEGVQVDGALVHLLGGAGVDAEFAQGEGLDEGEALGKQGGVVQAQADLDGEVARAEFLAPCREHLAKHAFIA